MACGCLADAPNHWLALHLYVTVFTRDSDWLARAICCVFLFVEKRGRLWAHKVWCTEREKVGYRGNMVTEEVGV